jgi:hypothetical protein
MPLSIEAWRATLPWHDSFALPRIESSNTHCRATNCRDTNWGGQDRTHLRSSTCPPLAEAKRLDTWRIDRAAEEAYAKYIKGLAPAAPQPKESSTVALDIQLRDSLVDDVALTVGEEFGERKPVLILDLFNEKTQEGVGMYLDAEAVGRLVSGLTGWLAQQAQTR